MRKAPEDSMAGAPVWLPVRRWRVSGDMISGNFGMLRLSGF